MSEKSGRRCCSWKVKAACVIAFGLVLTSLGVVLVPVFESVIHENIKENVILRPGTLTYGQFIEPDVPIYMQFYVFDVKNPEEIKNGERPLVLERGPYTYREHRKKFNVTHNPNGTVSYRQIRTFHFDRNKSVGDATDTFTTVNLVMLTLLSALKKEPKAFNWILTELLPVIKEDLFMTRSVNETVFGYNDTALWFGHLVFKQWFYTYVAGVFINKNNTDDGEYTIFTGEDDIHTLGVIDQYNGSRFLDFWNTSYANMVNGTDGTLCPPFINKTVTLPLFSTDVCRSAYGKYHSEVRTKHGDIPIYLFTGDHNELASAEENPDNAGFCTDKCYGSGVVDISVCQYIDSFHLPVFISFPHFYMADRGFIDNVTGMHPNEVKHRTEVGVEPLTGIVMRVAKRIQINMMLEPVPGVSMTSKVQPTIFPVLWVNENFEATQSIADQFYSDVTLPVLITKFAKYGLMSLGCVLILAGILYVFYKRRKKSNFTQMTVVADRRTANERTPILT